MSNKSRRRNQNKHKAPSSAQVPTPEKATVPPPLQGARKVALDAGRKDVARLIRRGDFKAAVDRAKTVHEKLGAPESESLLVDAWSARIEDMFDRGLLSDGAALLKLVQDRFPSSAAMLDELAWVRWARSGAWDEVAKGLIDPTVSDPTRSAIERVIQKEVIDLDAFAQASTWPADHPLRTEALLLHEAFTRVTTGPVSDEQVNLAGVPRRSPLAAWKALVRALAHLHRNEDSLAEKALGLIDLESAPARLVPVLRSLLSGGSPDALDAKAKDLVRQIGGDQASLRRVFERLDRAIESRGPKGLLGGCRDAIDACRQVNPSLFPRFLQALFVHGTLLEMDLDDIASCARTRPALDANYRRLMAQATEFLLELSDPDIDMLIHTCVAWELFRSTAIREGWFCSDGPEEACLHLHLAELLGRVPPQGLSVGIEEWLEEEEFSSDEDIFKYFEFPDREHMASFLQSMEPSQLFEKAARMLPRADVCMQWIQWARTFFVPNKEVDKAAGVWHEVDPKDPRPLLILVESSEKRRALKKAMAYLDEAESINSLDPAVRKARLRLLIASARRHIREHKMHLAEKDIESMKSLSWIQEGDRSAFVSALQWWCATISGNEADAAAYQQSVIERLGSPIAAHVVLRGVAESCAMKGMQVDSILPTPKVSGIEGLTEAVIRSLVLGDEMETPFQICSAWETPLTEDLKGLKIGMGAASLRHLGQAALRSGQSKLGYAVSSLGLRLSRSEVGRFLFLRAQCLPGMFRYFDRKEGCFLAAMALARRYRDMELLDKIVDCLRNSGMPSSLLGGGRESQLDESAIDAILNAEKAASEPPSPRDEMKIDPEDDCQCPDCRRRRARGTREDRKRPSKPGRFAQTTPFDVDEDIDDDFDLDFDEIFDEEFDEDFDDEDTGPPISPRMSQLIVELLAKFGDRSGRPPDMERVRKCDPVLFRKLREETSRMVGTDVPEELFSFVFQQSFLGGGNAEGRRG